MRQAHQLNVSRCSHISDNSYLPVAILHCTSLHPCPTSVTREPGPQASRIRKSQRHETVLTNDCDPRPRGSITSKFSHNSRYIGTAILPDSTLANRLSFISQARVSILFSRRIRALGIGPIVGYVHLYSRRIDFAVVKPI